MALDPTRPRDAVIAAGRHRLLTHAIDGLRSQLNASVLAAESPVSRDTAYRVFRGDGTGESVTDAVVAAVAGAANDPSWNGFELAHGDALAAYQASLDAGDDDSARWCATLAAVFEAQFRSVGNPVGWTLQAAALAASPAWQGEPPAADGVDLARTILAARRAHYQVMTDQFVEIAQVAMSDLGRRPRADVDPRGMVVLSHALLDGAMLRRFIEPEAVPPALVAEAILQLWLSFSEQGGFDDPRRPDDERGRRLFDRLLDGAADLWSASPQITVDAAAERAGVPVEAAALLFPDVGDLADSLMRARVVGGGFVDLGPVPDACEARQHLPVLVSELQRLRDLADAIPYAVAASRLHRPVRSKPFADDFADNEGRAVAPLVRASHARQLVEDLLCFAGQGSPGWASVEALLRTIAYPAGQPA
jgi:hypothetical protein